MTITSKVIVAGLGLPESPRWRDNKLWYLDMNAHTLCTVDIYGEGEVVRQFDERPSAFDFLPDGSALVAFRNTRIIHRLDDMSVYADLNPLRTRAVGFESINDMVIDGHGRVYIDCYMPGREHDRPEVDTSDAIAIVEPNGEARIGAVRVFGPNGLTINPENNRLVVAEPTRRRLVSFSIDSDGGLSDHRVLASFDGVYPDGICSDSAGGVWTSTLRTREVVRVDAHGEATDTVATQDGHYTIAAMIGGPDRRHLFIASCQISEHPTSWDMWEPEDGFIEVAEIDTPGGGWPGN